MNATVFDDLDPERDLVEPGGFADREPTPAAVLEHLARRWPEAPTGRLDRPDRVREREPIPSAGTTWALRGAGPTPLPHGAPPGDCSGWVDDVPTPHGFSLTTERKPPTGPPGDAVVGRRRWRPRHSQARAGDAAGMPLSRNGSRPGRVADQGSRYAQSGAPIEDGPREPAGVVR